MRNYQSSVSPEGIVAYFPKEDKGGYLSRIGLRKIRRLFPRTKIVSVEESEENISGVVESEIDSNYKVLGVCSELQVGSSFSRRTPFRMDLNLKGNGPYESTVFGLPTVCLLSRDGKTFEEYTGSGEYFLDSNQVPLSNGDINQKLEGKVIGIVPQLRSRTDLLGSFGEASDIPYEEIIDLKEKPYGTETVFVVDKEPANRNFPVKSAIPYPVEDIDAVVDIILGEDRVRDSEFKVSAVMQSIDGVLLGNRRAMIDFVNR
ncbi:hypothetical protein ISS07_00885 [Candidatus Woesearchaeota archaeon]|nr:hypothetical protein [Candidatus Woesearchaeota archaeon]